VQDSDTIGWLAAGWRAPPGVHAGTTTRRGGASAGGFASFNLAANVGDAPAAVAANRARLGVQLALPGEPLWLRQVHGAQVVVHDGAAIEPEADAAVAFEPGRVLAVLTADCLPVVLTSGDGRCIAVAHAGWRGLAAGVLERTVEALAGAAGGLLAWLGPAIGPSAFEVGAEVREALLSSDAGATAAFAPNARGRWLADLESLARRRLTRLGVAVAGSGACTFTDRERFYSFRREARCGRMATLVWLEARDALGVR
jgi:YfiH family protein